MRMNSRLFWICMGLLVAAMVFVYTVQAGPQSGPRLDNYVVIVTWLDDSITTVTSDHVYIKDGWIAIHVTQHPVGMLFIPSFGVAHVSALEKAPTEKPDILSVQK